VPPSLPSAAEAAFAWTGGADDESGELKAVLGLLWKNAAFAVNKKGEVEVDASTATYRRSGRFIFRTRTKEKNEKKEKREKREKNEKREETEHTLKVRAALSERPTQAEVDKLLEICVDAPKDELDVGAEGLAAASVATSCEVAAIPSGWGLDKPSREIRVQKWELVTAEGPDGVKPPPPCRLDDWTLERWEAGKGEKGKEVLWEISAKGSRAHTVKSFADCTAALQKDHEKRKLSHESKTSWAFGGGPERPK
jgi:hypothetical protein